ncbi:MAG: hypothetical protein ACI4TW_02555 [Prevotella sp.]
MAKRRITKRNINIICEELLAECVAVSLYSVKADDENVSALLRSIIHLSNDYVCRVSHIEPGIKPKQYFRKLFDSFNNDVNEIIDQINNMH